MLMAFLPLTAEAKRDVQAEINQVQAEKKKMRQLRLKLESSLHILGQSLQNLDQALIRAREQSELAEQAFEASDQKVKTLEEQVEQLKLRIQQTQQQIQHEAASAWMRAGRVPGWPDLLAGVSVTEIPHRKYLTRTMIEHQQELRAQWHADVQKLQEVKQSLLTERDVLKQRLEAKRQAEDELKEKRVSKQKHLHQVKNDVSLKQRREKELEKQEKALQQILENLQFSLLQSDKDVNHLSIRKKKGHLPWPVQGKIVASFGSMTPYQSSRIRGVIFAPAGSSKTLRQVRSIEGGQVRYADWFGGFGLMMIVEHGDGMMTIYAHNDALYHQVGDWVEAGEVLAEAGSTGWVEQTRLYFEMRDNGKSVNPKQWMTKK